MNVDINKILANWIPIVLILLFASYPDNAANFSHTILGRLLASALIIYYTTISTLAGASICVLIILFYQSDYANGIVMREEMNLYLPIKKEMKTREMFRDSSAPLKHDFQNKNCVHLKLKHKGLAVNPEMTEHVFPEIEFDGNACNVCDDGCAYNIVDRLEKEEEMVLPKQSNDYEIVD